MKMKLIVLSLVLLLVVSLTACNLSGSSGNQPTETTMSNDETTVPDEDTTVPDEDTTVPDAVTTVPDEETTDSDEEQEQPKPHEHDWSDWSIVTPATCTVDGEKVRTCACGEKETEVIDATGHADGAWSVDQMPTHSEEGKKHQVCTVCEETIKEEVMPKLTYKGLDFQINNDGETCTITGIGSCEDTALIIPETIDGYRVTSIGYSAFENCTSLTSVTIPDSVTSIGDDAFNACYKLVEVYNLSSSLTVTKGSRNNGYIGYYALDVYTSADAVSKLWTDEDGYQFYEDGDTCYLLGYTGAETELTLLANCNGKPYDIYQRAFSGCTSLTSVTIPDSVTSIGEAAFYGCTSLTSVYITDLEAWCKISFYNYASNPMCNGAQLYLNNVLFTEIEIPDSVTTIKDYAFYNCKSLTSVTIPDSVTSIGDNAFDRCTSLTSVVISDSVTSIGDYAFRICISLTSVTIPDSVTSIGSGAFENCTSLTSVTIPDSVTSIGDYAFYACRILTSVTIPDSVTSIGSFAFYGCDRLTSVVIGDSVTSIGKYAFDGCDSLISVYITDLEAWCNISFYSYDSNPMCNGAQLYLNNVLVTEIEIPDSVTSIGSFAFSGCTSLTSVTIPDSVTSIGDAAFYGCTSLTSVTIPDSVTSIGEGAFAGCANLTSVVIPDSVTSIGGAAFYGCTSLDIVYYGGTTDDWNAISIDDYNEPLIDATRYYYSETEPTTVGNYWHYVDGVPTKW